MFGTNSNAALNAFLASATIWVEQHLLGWSTAAQIVFAAMALLVLWVWGRRAGGRLRQRALALPAGVVAQTAAFFAGLAPWFVLLLVLKLAALGFAQSGQPDDVLRLVFSLTLAWVIIRISTGLVRDRAIARTIAVIGWVIAALNIAGLIGSTAALLDSAAITVGTFRLSLFIVLKGALYLTVLLWLGGLLARLIEQRVRAMPQMAPAMQVLIAKLTRLALLALAIVLALGSVGIDLTAFAVFSGAIGVGIGLGLQKVVSNLVSGIILLIDKSIKPGDVIQIDNTYGWITQLNARYVSVVTRDGLEYLIPNEDLITQRVVNWTYSNDSVRLHADIGIAYGADVHQAIRICKEAAAAVDRILETPPTVCFLTGFGDSAVNLQLRFWINDPRNGTANVKSAVLLEIWDRFQAAGIEIPFPQRDLTIRNPEALADAITTAMRAGGLA